MRNEIERGHIATRKHHLDASLTSLVAIIVFMRGKI